jgi:hypothetical protein
MHVFSLLVHSRSALSAAVLALALPAFATVQQPKPAIALVDPHPAEVKTLARRGGASVHVSNMRQFSRQTLNHMSTPEIFTFNMERETTISSIKASNDFHITGGSCVERRHYEAGESCTVEVAFRPTGAGHRTGTLNIQDAVSVKPLVTPLGGEAFGPAVSLGLAF